MIARTLFALLLGTLARESIQELNNRPILGVLLQENGNASSTEQFIASSYIKYVEMAGARVVGDT